MVQTLTDSPEASITSRLADLPASVKTFFRGAITSLMMAVPTLAQAGTFETDGGQFDFVTAKGQGTNVNTTSQNDGDEDTFPQTVTSNPTLSAGSYTITLPFTPSVNPIGWKLVATNSNPDTAQNVNLQGSLIVELNHNGVVTTRTVPFTSSIADIGVTSDILDISGDLYGEVVFDNVDYLGGPLSFTFSTGIVTSFDTGEDITVQGSVSSFGDGNVTYNMIPIIPEPSATTLGIAALAAAAARRRRPESSTGENV